MHINEGLVFLVHTLKTLFDEAFQFIMFYFNATELKRSVMFIMMLPSSTTDQYLARKIVYLIMKWFIVSENDFRIPYILGLVIRFLITDQLV